MEGNQASWSNLADTASPQQYTRSVQVTAEDGKIVAVAISKSAVAFKYELDRPPDVGGVVRHSGCGRAGVAREVSSTERGCPAWAPHAWIADSVRSRIVRGR